VASQRNWGARLREGTWLGTPTLTLENENLRLGIFVERGAEVFECLYKPLDLDLVWIAAAGFRDAATREALGPSSDPVTGFLNNYGGGWQEVLPNAGSPSSYAGASFGLHADVGQLPWSYELVEDDENCVSVRLTVRSARLPLLLHKEITLRRRSQTIQFVESVTNESDVEVRFTWGHHLAFGRPFLTPGARIVLPAGTRAFRDPGDLWPERRVAGGEFEWPNASSPSGEPIDVSLLPDEGEPSEMIYLHGFDDPAWYQLENHGIAVRVEWAAKAMPYLWFWQEYGATRGYPWFGRHWNIGLEPFSSCPADGLENAVQNGTALLLGPRESLPSSMTIEVGKSAAAH
jgi:galactose mutarotase-like enzyme